MRMLEVGDVYDPAQLRFDHHQRGFFETADGIPGAAKGPEEAGNRALRGRDRINSRSPDLACPEA